MAHDERQHGTPLAGPDAPAGPVVPARKTVLEPQRSLASLLDLTDEDLDLPMPSQNDDLTEWDGAAGGATGVALQDDRGDLSRPDVIMIARDVVDRDLFALHGHDTSSQPSDHRGSVGTVGDQPQDSWVVTGMVSEAPLAEPPELIVRSSAPAQPLAIATKPTKGPRRRPDTPVANFTQTDPSASVLWPRRPTPSELGAGAPECARCRAPFLDGKCTACGHGTPIRTRVVDQNRSQRIVSYFVHSRHRILRTLGTLLIAPGLLTGEYLAGHRRRYYSPFLVAGVAIVVFTALSFLVGLRVRPDRVLYIGDDRTEEIPAGMIGAAVITNQPYTASRDALDVTLRMINMLPPLWLPLTMCCIIAVLAGIRITQRREGPAEVVYTAHVSAFYVLWWALAVPGMLLAIRYGFELSAYFDGVHTVQYLEDGQIAGLSPEWHRLRASVATPLFHSALMAIGLVPYSILAYRRAFDEKWQRSCVAGLAVAAIPLLLLVPFA